MTIYRFKSIKSTMISHQNTKEGKKIFFTDQCNELIDTREIIVYMDSPWSEVIAFHFVTLSSRRKTLKKLQISAFFHIFTSSSVHIAKLRKTEEYFFILGKILKKMSSSSSISSTQIGVSSFSSVKYLV